MQHVAIMKKSWGLISKIVSGEKTIESRWYQKKTVPWDKIKKGDTVFFKDAGEPVTAKAIVDAVKQIAFKNNSEVKEAVLRYGKRIYFEKTGLKNFEHVPNYCILVFLKDAKFLKKPFRIDKRGFGNASAWLITKNIKNITL